MRLHYARTEGLIGIPRSGIDFDALPPAARTVAIVADNGTGKSTLLGAIYAAIHLEMPDRPGNLVDQFRGQGELELVWSYGGHRYRSLIKVEGRQKEAFLFVDGATTSATGGGVSKYLAAIREVFLTPEESLATWFGAQTKAGAFTGLGKSEKRQFIVRSLALGVPVSIAARAKLLTKDADREVEACAARVGSLRAQQEPLPILQAAIGPQDDAVRSAAAERDQVGEQLAAIQQEEAVLAAKWQALAGLGAKINDQQDSLVARKARAAELRRAIAAQRALLDRAGDIQRAAAEAAALEASLADNGNAAAACEAQVDKLQRQAAEASKLALEIKDLENARDAAQRAAEKAKADQVAELANQLAGLQKERHAHATEERDLRGRTRSLEEKIAAATRSAAVLDNVLFGDACRPCNLVKHNVEARDAIPGLQADLAYAEAKQAQEKGQLEIIDAGIAKIEAEIAAAKARPVDAQVVEDLAAKIRNLEAQLAGLSLIEGDLRDARAELARLRSALAATETKVKAAQAMAAEVHALQAAEGRIRELEQDLAIVTREEAAVAETIASLQADLLLAQKQTESLPKVRQEIASLQAERETQERKLQQAQERLGEIRGQIKALEALTVEIAKAESERDAAAERYAVSNHLARAFGEEGVQALKIDAAGPEVSGMTNELLSACYGPRFKIEFQTQRALRSRDGMEEGFDIRILDSERGSALFDAKSGGERVILGEGLALGLSLFKSLRSGRRIETMIRDEADGALSPERALRYLEMLNRAATVGEFHRLLFVSHRQEIWEQADARLFLRPDGTFTAG